MTDPLDDSDIDLPQYPAAATAVPDDEISQIKRYKDFSTIDWVEDLAYENRVKRREIQHLIRSREPEWRIRLRRLFSSAQSWIVLSLIGISIGTIAATLNIVTEWLGDIKTGRCTVAFYLNKDFCCSHEETCPEWKEWVSFGPFNYLLYVLFSAFFAFVSAFLVYSFAPYAAGSGISEIKCIVAGFIMKGFLGPATLAIKSITLPLAIASGLSVGKEGPSVHYAACVGNSIARYIKKYRQHNAKMREVIVACTAAGVAVAFGSPMGGVLFSLEEISVSFNLKTMWRSYFCALVSVATLAYFNPFRSGQLVLFSVKYDHDWHMFETFPFIIIGVFGGCYGIFTSKYNLWWQAFRKKYLGKFAVEEATFLATITAVICYFNQFLRIDMTESMQVLFRECSSEDGICNPSHRARILFSLLVGVIIRTLLVIISYGAKVPSGIFVPSMAVGALFGRFVGIVMQSIQEAHPSIFSSCPADGAPCITPGTYAFLGAAAALSGIMNLTITVVVIMFELTGALKYLIPTMIVVGVTKLVNDNWGKGGIADQAITANGFPFLEKEEHYFGVDVTAAMTPDPASLHDNMTHNELEEVLAEYVQTGYPIVDPVDNSVIGYIGRADIEYVLKANSPQTVIFSNPQLPLGRLVNLTPITVRPHMSLERVIEIFQNLAPRIILIDNELGQLQGVITRKDVLRYQYRLRAAAATAGRHQSHNASKADELIWNAIVKVVTGLKQRISP